MTSQPAAVALTAPSLLRAGIVDALDRAVRGNGIVVVDAPAGSGVTALVEAWAVHAGPGAVLVSAADGPEAVRRAVPRASRLVVDDAHLLDDADLRDSLARCVRDGAVRLVLAGHGLEARGRVPDALSGLAASRFTARDLAIGAGEAASLVEVVAGVRVPAALLEAVVAACDGHLGTLVEATSLLASASLRPAGSGWSAGSARRTVSWRHPEADVAPGEVAERFRAAVVSVSWSRLERAGADVVRLASRTALLDRMPEALVPDLLGDRSLPWRVALATARTAGLVRTVPEADGAPSLVWTAGVRTVVRGASGSGSGDAQRAVLRVVLESRAAMTVRAEAAVRLGDLDALAALLTAAWPTIGAATARVLAPLSIRRAVGHPVVLAAIARAETAAGHPPARANRALAASIRAVAARLPVAATDELPFLHALDSRARRLAGDRDGAVLAVARAAEALSAIAPLEALAVAVPDSLAPVLPFVLGEIAVVAAGEGDDLWAFRLLDAIDVTWSAPTGADAGGAGAGAGVGGSGFSPTEAVSVAGATALLRALRGEVTVATDVLRRAPSTTASSPLTAMAEAAVAIRSGDPDTAVDALRRIGSEAFASEYWPYALALRARADLLRPHVAVVDVLDAFVAERDRARPRIGTTRAADHLLRATEAALLLALGRVGEACDVLGDPAPWNVVEHAAVEAVRDDPASAARMIAAAQAVGDTTPGAAVALGLHRAVALARLEGAGGAGAGAGAGVGAAGAGAGAGAAGVGAGVGAAGAGAGALDAFRAAVDQAERLGLRGALLNLPRRDALRLADAAAAIGDTRASSWLDTLSGVRHAVPDPGVAVVLTERETIVLGMLAGPGSTTWIAEELHVSVNTVKTQLRSVYRKLGVSDRRGAIDAAREQGLLPG